MDKDEIKALFLMKFRIDHPKTLKQRVEEIKARKKQRQKLKYSEVIRECKHCGKKFTPTSFINVYCCVWCRIAEGIDKKKKENAHKPKLAKCCAWCGKQFKTKLTHKKYCRPMCAYAAQLEQAKGYQRRKKIERKNHEIDRQIAC